MLGLCVSIILASVCFRQARSSLPFQQKDFIRPMSGDFMETSRHRISLFTLYDQAKTFAAFDFTCLYFLLQKRSRPFLCNKGFQEIPSTLPFKNCL